MQSVVGFWPFFVGITAVLGAATYLSFLKAHEIAQPLALFMHSRNHPVAAQ